MTSTAFLERPDGPAWPRSSARAGIPPGRGSPGTAIGVRDVPLLRDGDHAAGPRTGARGGRRGGHRPADPPAARILTQLAGAEHRAALERGDMLAILYCSEFGIYGRYGYGPATRFGTWTIDVRATQVVPRAGRRGDGRVRGPGDDDEGRRSATCSRRGAPAQVSEIRRRDMGWEFRSACGPSRGAAAGRASSSCTGTRPAGRRVPALHGACPRRRARCRRARSTSRSSSGSTTPPRPPCGASSPRSTSWPSSRPRAGRVADRLPWRVTNPRAATLSGVSDGLWVRLLDVRAGARRPHLRARGEPRPRGRRPARPGRRAPARPGRDRRRRHVHADRSIPGPDAARRRARVRLPRGPRPARRRHPDRRRRAHARQPRGGRRRLPHRPRARGARPSSRGPTTMATHDPRPAARRRPGRDRRRRPPTSRRSPSPPPRPAAANGRALPRRVLGQHVPAADRPDPIVILEAQGTTRRPGAAADPLRADGRLAVRLLPRRGRGHGRRPRAPPRAPGFASSSAATRTCRTSASIARRSARSSSTSTTSTRRSPAPSSGTSSGWPRASSSPAGRSAGRRRGQRALLYAMGAYRLRMGEYARTGALDTGTRGSRSTTCSASCRGRPPARADAAPRREARQPRGANKLTTVVDGRRR